MNRANCLNHPFVQLDLPKHPERIYAWLKVEEHSMGAAFQFTLVNLYQVLLNDRAAIKKVYLNRMRLVFGNHICIASS